MAVNQGLADAQLNRRNDFASATTQQAG